MSQKREGGWRWDFPVCEGAGMVPFRILLATRDRNPNELTQSWLQAQLVSPVLFISQLCFLREEKVPISPWLTIYLLSNHSREQRWYLPVCPSRCLASGFIGLPGPCGCSWGRGSMALAPPELCGPGVVRVVHQRKIKELYLKKKEAGGHVIQLRVGL